MTMTMREILARPRARARKFLVAVAVTASAGLAASCAGEPPDAKSPGTAQKPAAAVPPASDAAGGDPSGAAAGEPGEPGEHGQEPHAGEASRVTLTEAAFGTARIVVEPVVAAPAVSGGVGLEVPGQVELDPRRVALVSSRIAGRIERLAAVEGDRVVAGQPVAYIYSPAFLVAQADLEQSARRANLLAGTEDERASPRHSRP